MSLNPKIKKIFGLAKKANFPEIWQLTPDQGREHYLMRVNKLKFNEPIWRTEDRRISGPGSHIPIRIYTPREIKSAQLLSSLPSISYAAFSLRKKNTKDCVSTAAPENAPPHAHTLCSLDLAACRTAHAL